MILLRKNSFLIAILCFIQIFSLQLVVINCQDESTPVIESTTIAIETSTVIDTTVPIVETTTVEASTAITTIAITTLTSKPTTPPTQHLFEGSYYCHWCSHWFNICALDCRSCLFVYIEGSYNTILKFLRRLRSLHVFLS